MSRLAVTGAILLGACSSIPDAAPIPLIDLAASLQTTAKPPLVSIEDGDTPATPKDTAARHNARVIELGDLWAHAEVSLTWTDDDDRTHADVFGGYMMLQQPNNVYLSLDKAGVLAMVAGSDNEHFWIISLLDEPTATWICRIDNVGLEGCEALPEFLLPHELILLSGLVLIPTDSDGFESDAAPDGVTISWAAGDGYRSLRFPTDSWVPDRVSLYSADGTLVAESRLGNYRPVEDETTPQEEWIYAPGYIHVIGPLWNGEVILQASELRVRPHNRDRIGSTTFSFSYLQRAYPTQELHVLDAKCTNPAIVIDSD